MLTTSDHKVIGQLYIGASMLGALIVGVLGVLLGAERIDGDGTLLDSNAINQLFAGYRVGLVFALAVPLFLGIALYVVPLQLGARALAFPRAAAAGFWAWFGGVVLLIVALFNNGGPFGGNHDMVELYLGAYVVMLVGITASAGDDRRVGAHHPGAGHAHAEGAAVRLVGAGVGARAGAGAAGRWSAC